MIIQNENYISNNHFRTKEVLGINVSLSLKLSKNVEQQIRKKVHAPNALRFWIEVVVISLCGLARIPLCLRSLWCLFPRFSQQVVSKLMICDGDWLRQVQFDPYIESLSDGGFKQANLVKCVNGNTSEGCL